MELFVYKKTGISGKFLLQLMISRLYPIYDCVFCPSCSTILSRSEIPGPMSNVFGSQYKFLIRLSSMGVVAPTMDPPLLVINKSTVDTYKPITEVHQPVENIELKPIGDDGPHRHVVEVSVDREKSYTSKILVIVCLTVCVIVGGALMTSVRDWNQLELGGWNMIQRGWGDSLPFESLEYDYNDSDPLDTQVGRAWRVPYLLPTLFVKRETVYDKILPFFPFQREVFGVALMPPESITFKKRKLNDPLVPNSTKNVREKRFVFSATVFIILFWSTMSAAAAASVAGGIAHRLTREYYEEVLNEYETKLALLQTTTPEPEYQDYDYALSDYIDPDKLWTPVVDRGDGLPDKPFSPGSDNRQLYVPKPPRTPKPMTHGELNDLIKVHNALQQQKLEANSNWVKSQQELETILHPKAVQQMNQMSAEASIGFTGKVKSEVKLPRGIRRGKRETDKETRKNPFDIISEMNTIMGLENPPLWDWDASLFDFELDSDVNYDRTLPPLRDNLEHENDVFQSWIYSPSTEEYERKQRLIQSLYYKPLTEMNDTEVTKRWKVHNVTDMRGKYLVSDNYYKTGGSLSNQLNITDPDTVDGQNYEGDGDVKPEAVFDNSMATRRGQLESKWRCHGSQPCIWDESRRKKRSLPNELPPLIVALMPDRARDQHDKKIPSGLYDAGSDMNIMKDVVEASPYQDSLKINEKGISKVNEVATVTKNVGSLVVRPPLNGGSILRQVYLTTRVKSKDQHEKLLKESSPDRDDEVTVITVDPNYDTRRDEAEASERYETSNSRHVRESASKPVFTSNLVENTDADTMPVRKRRVTRSPQLGAMSALQTVAEAVRHGKDISKAGGWIKDFVYAIAAPMVKNLNRDRNVHAIKGFTRRLIPQTGFNAHPAGQFVLDKVKENDFQAALDKMAQYRTHFDVKGMWALQDQDRVSEHYKQCRKILPHVDTLLTERMKSQSAVETSLVQALFSELKAVVRMNVTRPILEAKLVLEDLSLAIQEAKFVLEDLDLDHFYDRLVIFIMCGVTLVMCVITVLMSCKMRLDILQRVDTVMRETGVNGIVRTDQPSDDSVPLMSPYRNVPRRPRRQGLTDDSIETMAQAVHRRMQSTGGVKSKSPPTPPMALAST